MELKLPHCKTFTQTLALPVTPSSPGTLVPLLDKQGCYLPGDPRTPGSGYALDGGYLAGPRLPTHPTRSPLLPHGRRPQGNLTALHTRL